MKKLLIFFLVFSFVFLCPSLYAQGMKGKFAISGNGGLSLPMADFADEEKGGAETGAGFGASVEYFISDNVSIGGNFTHRNFGLKTHDAEREFKEEILMSLPGADAGLDLDGDYKIPSFGVFGKYSFSTGSQISPFLKLGVGLGTFKGSIDMDGYVAYAGERLNITGSQDVSESKTYLDLGAGFLYMVSDNVAFTGEALFTHLLTDGAEGDTEITMNGYHLEGEAEVDFNSDYITLFATLTFFLGETK